MIVLSDGKHSYRWYVGKKALMQAYFRNYQVCLYDEYGREIITTLQNMFIIR